MQPQLRKKRVLIADTTQETRRNTRVMLSSVKGVEVVAIALDGTQAIEMARLNKPDIILLDVNMSKGKGLAAYKLIAQENPRIACVLILGGDDPETFRAAKAMGIRHHLIKPFTEYELDEIMQNVIQWLDGRRSGNAQASSSNPDVAQLKRLAEEYVRIQRTDDEAVRVLEEAIQLPDSPLRWMQTLAMIYVVRQRWGKLKSLAERLEKGKK